MTRPSALLSLLVTTTAFAQSPSEIDAAPQAAEVDSDALIKQIQTVFEDTDSMTLQFVQHTHSPQFGDVPTQQGTLSLARPAKMRAQFHDDASASVITDGQTMWITTPALNQVIITPDLSATQGAFNHLLDGLSTLEEHFAVSVSPLADGAHELTLTPHQAAGVPAIRLTVDAQLLPVKLETEDGMGAITTMAFSDVQLDAHLDESTFVYVPTPDMTVIDTTSL